MISSTRARFVHAAVTVPLLALSAAAQCPEWAEGFGFAGADADVLAMTVADDGGGPALFAGGDFTIIGSESLAHVARWDGVSWTALGSGTNGAVRALVEFDDGGGPALYAAGSFTTAGESSANRIAKWDGASWSPLGTGTSGDVFALAVFDDGLGGGPALYAAGSFGLAGGVGVIRIARWNGATWSALGTGLDAIARGLAVYDDGLGAGPALYVCGDFGLAGGVSANRIARWDGSTWSALGTGLNLHANALTVFDGGGGAELIAGGHFNSAGGGGGNHIAKWNGIAWSPLPTGLNDDVRALTVYDDGGGAKLIAGGDFSSEGAGGPGLSGVASWDGSSWAPLAGGIGVTHALAAFDDGLGAGPRLFAGGSFTASTDALIDRLAVWDGTEWTKLGEHGLWNGAPELDGGVDPSSSAPALFAAHGRRALRLDDEGWTVVGHAGNSSGVRIVRALEDAVGPAVYAGGNFTSIDSVSASDIARWDGSNWAPLGAGVSGSVFTLEYLPFGPTYEQALYVGGIFSTAGGGSANNIAKWDGTAWSQLGIGLTATPPSISDWVDAVASFDDGFAGGGATIYATGNFTLADGVPALNIARWDGSTWYPLGSGIDDWGEALVVHDDGSGPALFVGGRFTNAGGASANRIAKWDGSAWSALGTGMDDDVYSLAVFDDGGGPKLYAAGAFTTAGGVAANHLAKWDGSSWSAVEGGVDGTYAYALAAHHDGTETGPDLYVAGQFSHAGDIVSAGFAKLEGCGAPGVSYCFGDDLDPLVTADCPCGNFGEPYHGCGNFPFTNGAVMTASGTTNPNSILFTCSDLPNNTLCTFLRGNNNIAAGFVFGDGVRCVQVPLLRFGQQNSGVGGNPPNTVVSATVTELPGVTRYYQCQYRNPVAGWCDPGLFNVSNGYRLAW